MKKHTMPTPIVTKRKKYRLLILLAIVGIFLVPPFAMAFDIVDSANLSISATACTTNCGGGNVNPGGGGGGGGAVGYFAPTAITFSGRAYPLSRVTVLQDGVIAITTIAGPDARFTISLQNLTTGNFSFSVYAQDSAGRRSTVFSFPLYVTYGATTEVSGIFIAPTIDVNKTQVKQGDNIQIFGVSAPSSDIVISVHSDVEHFVQTKSDSNGVYFYSYDTSPLEIGLHQTKSKATLPAIASEYGKIVAFTIGNKNIEKEGGCNGKGDLNHDCRVNLVDFSILAYWYKRQVIPSTVDLNTDKSVTIVDFSILAYYWTG